MKRIFLTFCSVISIVWLMPMFVKAYTAPNGIEYEYKYTVSWYESRYYDLYSNIPFGVYTVNANRYGQYNIGCVYNDALYFDCDISLTNYNLVSTGYKKYPTQENVNVILPENVAFICNQNGTTPTNSDNLWATTSNMPITGSTYEELYNNLYDEMHQVDYDDLIFDPSIPVPKFTSLYGILPLWNLGGSVTPQFPIQTYFNDMPDYKIEVQVRYYSPSKITFNGSRRSAFSEDWTINYKYDSLMPSEWYPIVTMQDDIQNNELVLVDSDYYYSWNNFITGYDSELIEFVLDPVFISASANTSIKAYAETEFAKMRNIGGCYGNQFEIMARNFYINNGNVFVGNWFHWNSLTPENGTAEYSNDARQDNVVNGVQNTVNTSELPTGNSLTTIGEPTGNAYNPSNNIIINQNVPNYPDYPTVADYNRDNILVGMIKTAKAMPQYFGEFNQFLTAAFSFIDSSVWAVIALGFSASIVIMIIKVL